MKIILNQNYKNCVKTIKDTPHVSKAVIVNPQRLQGQPTNIEMLIKLLYCLLIPLIKGNLRYAGGLVNMYEDWQESLLFIYYEQKIDLKSLPKAHLQIKYLPKNIFQNPDCFAYKLSPSYAFTTSSCFMNLENISEMLKNHESHESIMDRIFSGNEMKPSIKKFDVVEVQVLSRYFT